MLSSPISVTSRRIAHQALRSSNTRLEPASRVSTAEAGAAGRTAVRRRLSTYYDSQSGLHLPVHDETKIRLYLDVRGGYCDRNTTTPTGEDGDGGGPRRPLVPYGLIRDRTEADEVAETLGEWTGRGIHGAVLPPIEFPRDVRNLRTLAAVSPHHFSFLIDGGGGGGFGGAAAEVPSQSSSSSSSSATFSKTVRYGRRGGGFREVLRGSAEMGLHTTLAIEEDAYVNDDENGSIDPIELANDVAATIDGGGGCDNIWIRLSKEEEGGEEEKNVGDDMVRVCEELIYLDVAGATIKSRLLLDFLNEDVLEDILFMGVNKFIIQNMSQIEAIESVAEEQGKLLLRL